MPWLWAIVALLVALGSVLVLAEQTFGELWVTVLSFAFTIAYFVVVEAMSKTFGILHSASVALTLAPVVWALGRALRVPTRLLIGLANVLLPGKGLKEGPFVTPEEIRSMAEVGREEGTVGTQEREIIHSLFDLGDMLVREVMVPRPDIVAVPATCTLQEVLDLMLASGHWRIPVYRDGGHDRSDGIRDAATVRGSRDQAGGGASHRDAIPARAHRDRGRRVRVDRGLGDARGRPGGAGRRDRRRVRPGGAEGGGPRRRDLPRERRPADQGSERRPGRRAAGG